MCIRVSLCLYCDLYVFTMISMCLLWSLCVYYDLYVFSMISMCFLWSLCVYYDLYVYKMISLVMAQLREAKWLTSSVSFPLLPSSLSRNWCMWIKSPRRPSFLYSNSQKCVTYFWFFHLFLIFFTYFVTCQWFFGKFKVYYRLKVVLAFSKFRRSPGLIFIDLCLDFGKNKYAHVARQI